MAGTDLVVPGTGEVIPLSTPEECAAAITKLDQIFEALKLAKREIAEATRELSETHMTKTMELGDGRKLVLRGGQETEYDADEIRADLIDAGIEEKLVDEIVLMQPVSYRLDVRRARRAADANATVAGILRDHSRTIPKPFYASIELPRQSL